ncbi:MAG: hypothetical protein GX663_02170 [Clostridiales bacterium]|nr:hypothetical protein [Clostridiales bacterium]
MDNDRYNRSRRDSNRSEEQRAREQAYQEYLRLRESRPGRGNYIKDDTLYGEYISSKSRVQRREEADYKQRMEAYSSQRKVRSNSPQQEREEYLKSRSEPSRQKIARQGRKNRADKGIIDEDKPVSGRKVKKKKSGGGSGGRGRKKGKGLKIALIVVLALVLVIGGTIAAGLTVVKNTLDNVGRIELDPDLIGIDPNVDEQLKGYRNIALLGIDARDMSSDEGVRSDAMIIASINKETGEIKMFSVYRDTMLDLGDDVGLDKATHAYYYGGPTKALYTLNKNLDLNIKEVVVVNWKSVADTVDALGGLDIEIQESEIEEMNKYIMDTYYNIGGSNALIESAGMQTLNGNQAVTYARIRKDATTGDYRRNERMKIVVQAAFEKAKTMKVGSLKRISNKILPEIKTNMSSMDMMGMVLKLNSYSMTDSVGWPYDVGNYSGDAWYGPPVTLSTNVTKLHEQFFAQEGYTPTQRVLDISEDISYETGLY